jgi:hypothetical protein
MPMLFEVNFNVFEPKGRKGKRTWDVTPMDRVEALDGRTVAAGDAEYAIRKARQIAKETYPDCEIQIVSVKPLSRIDG